MKRTSKRELNLNKPSFDLNKSLYGCVPCFKGVLKVDKKVYGRSLNQIKINEIKAIVKSIFKKSDDVNK